MGTKKLKPTLPKDEAEILKKGFDGNISDSDKFITDGHSLIVRAEASAEFLTFIVGIPNKRGAKPVKEASIQQCWDDTMNRKSKPADFIGVGKLGFDADDEPIIVGAVRKDNVIAGVNPWILKFAMLVTGADRLLVSSDLNWTERQIVLCRGGKAVAMIMPMRYSTPDFISYDLTGPAVPLSEV